MLALARHSSLGTPEGLLRLEDAGEEIAVFGDTLEDRSDRQSHPDDYRKAALKAVEKKEASNDVSEDDDEKKKSSAKGGKVVDLADMLSRSLSRRAVTKRAPAHAARAARTHRSRGTKKSSKRKAARR